jgi:hypothetical protein
MILKRFNTYDPLLTLAGVLGRSASHQRSLYASFFPTIMRRWWQEVVVGVDKVRRG